MAAVAITIRVFPEIIPLNPVSFPFIVVSVNVLPTVIVAPVVLLFPIIISPDVNAPPISMFASVIFDPNFNVVEIVDVSIISVLMFCLLQ